MKKILCFALIFCLTGCSMLASHPPVKQLNARDEALSSHNKWRAAHRAPALRWDNALAAYAAHYASRCEFKHSGGPYGENLAAGYPTVPAAINAWYVEKAHYDYRHPGFSKQTGHFTQMIWRSTQTLGCAYVVCQGLHGTPGKFLVCEYGPPGNVLGASYFAENVLP